MTSYVLSRVPTVLLEVDGLTDTVHNSTTVQHITGNNTTVIPYNQYGAPVKKETILN